MMSPDMSRRLARVAGGLRIILPRDVFRSMIESDAQKLEDLPKPVQTLVLDLEGELARGQADSVGSSSTAWS